MVGFELFVLKNYKPKIPKNTPVFNRPLRVSKFKAIQAKQDFFNLKIAFPESFQ